MSQTSDRGMCIACTVIEQMEASGGQFERGPLWVGCSKRMLQLTWTLCPWPVLLCYSSHQGCRGPRFARLRPTLGSTTEAGDTRVAAVCTASGRKGEVEGEKANNTIATLPIVCKPAQPWEIKEKVKLQNDTSQAEHDNSNTHGRDKG
jgi:hypothetical protein